MAKVLNFNTAEEFGAVFNQANPQIADLIIEGITEAFQYHKKSAHLFTVNFSDEEFQYEINLPQSQWVKAIMDVRDKYHGWDRHDDAIDAHLLMKQVEEWSE